MAGPLSMIYVEQGIPCCQKNKWSYVDRRLCPGLWSALDFPNTEGVTSCTILASYKPGKSLAPAFAQLVGVW